MLTGGCAAAVVAWLIGKSARFWESVGAATALGETERLLAATGRLNASVDPEEVLAQLLELARELIDAGHLSVLTNEAEHLFVWRSWRDGLFEAAGAIVPAEQSVAGWVVAHRQTYRVRPGRLPAGVTHEDEIKQPKLAVPLLGRDGAVKAVVVVYRLRDGRPLNGRDQRLLEGLAQHAIVALERAALTTRLRRSEERFRSLVQQASDLIAVIDSQGRLHYVSPAVERVLHYSPNVLTGVPIERFICPEDLPGFFALLYGDRATPPLATHVTEFRMRCQDGSWRDLEVFVTNLLDEPGVNGFVLNARDITKRKALEEVLTAQAFSDALTGLANRVRFQQVLQGSLSPRRTELGAVAVLFLDLDGFKLINDTYGHAAGDRLLGAVAERLLQNLTHGETIARFGGDEFAVLLESVAHHADAVTVGEQLLAALRDPLDVDGRSILITASMGIAFRSPTAAGRQPEDLLREADIALYQAKEAGKDRVVLYESSMSSLAARRLELENDLRRALQRSEFRLYYQPIVELKTGKVISMEALVRWAHPRRGLLAPAEFLSVAEETGLITPLGHWVIDTACRQAADWNARWPRRPALVISVNLSAVQLEQTGLVEDIRAALTRTGLSPCDLQLELTETAVLHQVERTGAQLAALKAMGVRLAIDDFGTGYSSLSYLQRLDVDCLKIDRSFLEDLYPDSASVAIIRAILALAEALKTDTTMEGLETAEQVRMLQEMGCHHGQGYYLSEPLPEWMATDLLASGPRVWDWRTFEEGNIPEAAMEEP